MLSPWERGWAQGQAQGMVREQGAAQAIHQGAQAAAEEVGAEAPLLRATALTRTSKLVWTTSESLEQETGTGMSRRSTSMPLPGWGVQEDVSTINRYLQQLYI